MRSPACGVNMTPANLPLDSLKAGIQKAIAVMNEICCMSLHEKPYCS
jgi:hypothetical protein